MVALDKAQAIGGIIVKIDNRYLTIETPLARNELWLDISDL